MTARNKPADDAATATADAIADARDGDPSPDAITDAEAAAITAKVPVNANVISGSSFPGSDGRSFAVPLPLEPGEGIIGSTSDTSRESGGVNLYITNLGRRFAIGEDGKANVESVEDDAPEA